MDNFDTRKMKAVIPMCTTSAIGEWMAPLAVKFIILYLVLTLLL